MSVSSTCRSSSSAGDGVISSWYGCATATAVSRRRRADSLRHWSVSRRPATVTSQPAGSVGHAFRRPLHGRGEQRLLHGVLARVELAVPAHEHGQDPRRERAQQVLDRPGTRHHMSNPASNMIGRTSIERPLNFASGICCASSTARSLDSTSTM